jgi:hypothetical protein
LAGDARAAKGEARAARLSGESKEVAGEGATVSRWLEAGELEGEERYNCGDPLVEDAPEAPTLAGLEGGKWTSRTSAERLALLIIFWSACTLAYGGGTTVWGRGHSRSV